MRSRIDTEREREREEKTFPFNITKDYLLLFSQNTHINIDYE